MIEPPVLTPVEAPARGEPVTAAFLQSLAARVERLERGGVDPVAAVFAALPSGEFVQCRITARRFDGVVIDDNAEPGEVPSRFTYDIRGVRRNLVKTGLTPVYGREVRNDECLVYPAKVGSVCYFVRSPGAGSLVGELMLLPGCEVPARRRCGTQVNGGGGTGPGVIPPPPPPPPEEVGKGAGDSVAGPTSSASPGGGLSGGPGGIGGLGGGGDELRRI